ncbi:neuromedin-U isoform X2 [Brachyhypopomus gauderio]|uniref:neuromedin-U isoform X2 n=1 Tax=Brachyhypopomus gauderio TaxID=698409 RepID=UPI00404319F5
MKISRCQDGTSKSWSSSSSTVFPSAMTPLNLTTLTLAVFLMSAIPLCRSAPVFLNPATIEHDLLTQIIKVCTSQLSAERPLRTQDGLQDLCGLMLEVVRTAKELPVRDTSKRPNGAGLSDDASTVFHPLLQLMPQLHSRRRRRTAPLVRTSAGSLLLTLREHSTPGPALSDLDHCEIHLGLRRAREVTAGASESRLVAQEELQSPRTIQSRGYFLYRPRNGRRSTEYV